MNSLLNNFLLHDKVHTARSSLFLLITCCCMVISNNAFAQYPGNTPYSLLASHNNNQPSLPHYHADIAATETGGGTWGEILKMNVQVQGSEAIFTITSKKGPFYNTNNVNIRSMSHNGSIVVAGKIPSGSEAARLHLNLDTVTAFPHRFFATITNNVGYAWVGPIQIGKTEAATTTNASSDTRRSTPRNNVSASNGPQRPIISETPEKAVANRAVSIAVTAGKAQSNDMVRVQCTASSSDNTSNNPYRSGWLYSGDTINIPLTFQSAGTQAIFCNTLDSYGATSSLSQRTISVAAEQRFSLSRFSSTPPPAREFSEPAQPARPSITSQPPTPVRRRIIRTPVPRIEVTDQGAVNTPMSVKLIAGHDPQNRDLVRIRCTADDSNRTAQDLYQSDWLPPEAAAKGMFVFYSSGEKNIYCTSYSRQGILSPSTSKTVTISFANQAPGQPRINEYPNTTHPGKTIYISVTAGSDPDDDQVKVQCSATDSNIAANVPYTSEWMAPLSTIDAPFSFHAPGNKEITCVTIDRKNEQSEKAVRKIHVHSPHYNPGYTPNSTPNYTSKYNFNKKSAPAQKEDCGCEQQGATQQQGITFNQPYIPEHQNQQNVFQRPEPQPDLKGRVVYRSNRSPAQNALVKIFNAMSGRAYTATTDYNGEFKINFAQGSFTGQIQATKGGSTSSIREVKINVDKPTVIDLTIIDRKQAQPRSQPQSQSQWPARQAAPAHNSVWQFN